MKRFYVLAVPLLAAVLLCGGLAAGKSAQKSKASCRQTCETKVGRTTVMGPVKGTITGTRFVVAPKGGDVRVDASRATVRDGGKVVTLAALRPGTIVKVTGTIRHRAMRASEVCICGKSEGR